MGLQPKLPTLRWMPSFSDDENTQAVTPSQRYKLAACLYRGNVYMYGGASKTRAYKDLHSFHLATRTWTQLKGKGDSPGPLQGHTLLAYKNALYVFGGNFSYGGGLDEVPLWKYDILGNHWHKIAPKNNKVPLPSSRREHTVIQYSGHMIMYGGYVDLKGSSSELWDLDLESQQWKLIYSAQMDESGPGPRHGHTAVLHDNAMWVCGGMADLQPKPDMWRWHLGVNQWQKIKAKSAGPSELSSHSAVVVNGYMVVYGGTDLQTNIWLFHFNSLTWNKISCNGISPVPRFQHSAILFNQSSLRHFESKETQFSLKAISTSPQQTSSTPGNDNHLVRKESENKNKTQFPIATSSKFGSNRINPVFKADEKITKSEYLIRNRQFSNCTSNDTDSVQQGIESYKKFAEALNRSDSREGNSVAYQRQSSAVTELLKMKMMKRYNSQTSSSCDSLAQGCAPNDHAPLLKKRSMTLGDVSLNSQSGFDNPTFLNSTGNSSDLNASIRLRQVSFSSGEYKYSSDTLNENAHDPAGNKQAYKMRRMNKAKPSSSEPRQISRYKAKRKRNDFNRSASMDSILETSPSFDRETRVTRITEFSSHGNILGANLALPGSTDNIDQSVTPIRCLESDDLIIEDIEDFDLEPLESRSFSNPEPYSTCDVDFDHSGSSLSKLLTNNIDACRDGVSGVVNRVMDYNEDALDVGSASGKIEIPLEEVVVSKKSNVIKGENLRSSYLLSKSNQNFGAQEMLLNDTMSVSNSESNSANKIVGIDESTIDAENRTKPELFSSLSASYTNPVYYDTVSCGRDLGKNRENRIRNESQVEMKSMQENSQKETKLAARRIMHFDDSIETSFMTSSGSIDRTVKKSSGDKNGINVWSGMKDNHKNEFIMCVLGGKEENTGFITKPLSMNHLKIEF